MHRGQREGPGRICLSKGHHRLALRSLLTDVPCFSRSPVSLCDTMCSHVQEYYLLPLLGMYSLKIIKEVCRFSYNSIHHGG